MNPGLILSLITDLYGQVQEAIAYGHEQRAIAQRLEAENTELKSKLENPGT